MTEAEAELEVGRPVHGGHCLARHAGRVVFVRHAIPGERVRVRFTETGERRKYWRADAVEVLRASADRVPSAWPAAGPGGVGGGELAHVALPAQRRWKADVVSDALARIGRIERAVEVTPAPGDDERGGLGWRTRVELTADRTGRAGMYAYRSHDILPLVDLPLAAPAIRELRLGERHWPAGARIDAIAPSGDERPLLLIDGAPARGARRSVREIVRAGGREYAYRVSGAGFWQVHSAGPALLVEAVLAAAEAQAGETVLELYSGAGLLTKPLAEVVGPTGRVDSIEAGSEAVRDARRNLHDSPQVRLHTGDVARQLATGLPARADVVVLDPPRAGAGPGVMAALCESAPRRIVYVACDPAALARDVRTCAERGYVLSRLAGLDLFPHTHHVECVALLEPSGEGAGGRAGRA